MGECKWMLTPPPPHTPNQIFWNYIILPLSNIKPLKALIQHSPKQALASFGSTQIKSVDLKTIKKPVNFDKTPHVVLLLFAIQNCTRKENQTLDKNPDKSDFNFNAKKTIGNFSR